MRLDPWGAATCDAARWINMTWLKYALSDHSFEAAQRHRLTQTTLDKTLNF